jgi:hypothetical protein
MKKQIISTLLAAVMLLALIAAGSADLSPLPQVQINASAATPARTSGFTAPAQLTRQTMPPDLLTMWDGTAVDSREQWEQRKIEMRAMLEFYMYGPMRGRADDFASYSVSGNNLTINVAAGGRTANFTVAVTRPSGTAPAGGRPVILAIGGLGGQASYATGQGYAVINAPAYASTSGAFYTLYPWGNTWDTQSGYAASSAWAISKIIDALEAGAGTQLGIDPATTIVTGVSRNGKYAAAAGAFDERIKVTAPVVSGMGGVNMWRFNSDQTTWNMYTGPASLQHSPGGPYPGSGGNWGPIGNREGWGSQVSNRFFGGNASGISNRGSNAHEFAPVDAHFIAALAGGEGRYCFMISGLNWESTNGVPGIQYTYDLAVEVYQRLGIEANLAVQLHIQEHALDQESLVKIFVYLDHMEGRHSGCSGSCNMTPYRTGMSSAVQTYFNNWTFTMDSLRTTAFAAPANATTYTAATPNCCTKAAGANCSCGTGCVYSRSNCCTRNRTDITPWTDSGTTRPVCGEDDFVCESASCVLCNPPFECVCPTGSDSVRLYEFVADANIAASLNDGVAAGGVQSAGSPTFAAENGSLRISDRTAVWNALDVQLIPLNLDPNGEYRITVTGDGGGTPLQLTFPLAEFPWDTEIVTGTATSVSMTFSGTPPTVGGGSGTQGFRIRVRTDGTGDFSVSSVVITVVCCGVCESECVCGSLVPPEHCSDCGDCADCLTSSPLIVRWTERQDCEVCGSEKLFMFTRFAGRERRTAMKWESDGAFVDSCGNRFTTLA